MVREEIVGGELGRNAAPAAREAGAHHRHLRDRVPESPQDVGEQAGKRKTQQHQRDRQLLPGLAALTRRRAQSRADDPDDDREHRQVLVASRVLAEHALAEEQQHQQARGERRLHHHQRGQHQRDDLQRPAENRQSRAKQPASAPEQATDQGQAQVLLVGRLLGVHRLEGDP